MSAMMVLSIGVMDFEQVVPVLMLAASYGVTAKKEWGRRLIIFASGISLLFYLIHTFLIVRAFDYADAMYAIAWIMALLFYQTPMIANLYQSGFKSPMWKVLVVDDDKIFLKIVRKHFFSWGIIALTAETGEEGMAAARRHRPDLIILDVILPKMKGRAVCAALKEDALTQDIPVIFLTYKNSPDDVYAEMAAGAIVHIQKPVDFNLLYREIQNILGT